MLAKLAKWINKETKDEAIHFSLIPQQLDHSFNILIIGEKELAYINYFIVHVPFIRSLVVHHRQLAHKVTRFMLFATNRASLVNFALFPSKYYRFVPAVASLSRAYSYGPNAAHLPTRSFPKPAHTLMLETVYSPLPATRLCTKNFCTRQV